MSQAENPPQAVNLPDPGVPADQGLSSLGLLMQLAGSVFGAYACLATFTVMLMPRMNTEKGWLLLVLGACVARSLFHRAAGTELLYGKRSLEGTASPLSGTKRYILIGLIQSVAIAGVLISKFHMPSKWGVAMGVGLALWPAALAILLRLPRFRRFHQEIPVGEDKGFEGAAILMVVLGTCGVLGSGAFLLVMLDAGGALLRHGPGVLILGATVTLVIRSSFHVQAGLSGLRETNLDRSVELANRYANFGVISSFCAGAALLLMMMMAQFHLAMLVMVCGLCWMLLAWPLIIRRFFSDRQFADLLAGDEGSVHRRAPDAGLTSLGWLLFGHALFSAAFVIPQLVIGSDFGGGRVGEMMSMLGPAATRSAWWSAGVCVLEAWAGFELIRMHRTSRVLATVYAVVAGVVAVYVMWPVLKSLGNMRMFGGPQAVLAFIPLAIQLVIPIATLVLVNRKIAPTATARFRPRAPAAEPTLSPEASPPA